jgi:hypothetical protein
VRVSTTSFIAAFLVIPLGCLATFSMGYLQFWWYSHAVGFLILSGSAYMPNPRLGSPILTIQSLMISAMCGIALFFTLFSPVTFAVIGVLIFVAIVSAVIRLDKHSPEPMPNLDLALAVGIVFVENLVSFWFLISGMM